MEGFSQDTKFLRWLQANLIAMGLEFASPLKRLFPKAFYAFPEGNFDSSKLAGPGETGGPPYERSSGFLIFRGMDIDKFKSILSGDFEGNGSHTFLTTPEWPESCSDLSTGFE